MKLEIAFILLALTCTCAGSCVKDNVNSDSEDDFVPVEGAVMAREGILQVPLTKLQKCTVSGPPRHSRCGDYEL